MPFPSAAGASPLLPILGPFDLDRIDIVATDVFDTLLLRTLRSERSRLLAAERRFSRLLDRQGLRVAASVLMEARLAAQRLAFRSLEVGSGGGEVRLADIVDRQLRMLGLPAGLRQRRIDIEVEVEMRSLRPNHALADQLRALRRRGKSVVAISDTTLDASALRRLILHFFEPDLLDDVYSSAEEGATKRNGALFQSVARQLGTVPARMLHFGDDAWADVEVPARLGLLTRHLTRPPYRRQLRAVDGAAARLVAVVAGTFARPSPVTADPLYFGRDVLGPITAQFALMIWLYASQVREADRAVLLFCARGGIGIREAFERVVERLGLPLEMRRETLLVSRLVAARAALTARSLVAAEELGREFRGMTFAAVAEALGGRRYVLSDEWRQPFRPEALDAMLFAESGAEVRHDIERQNALFARHLAQVVGDAQRIILCDTGLFGSTQRLLAAGFPHLSFESVLFARSNYKRHGEEHFTRVTGLLVERSAYDPLDRRTAVLRFWHLVESLFEPSVSSVRCFAEDADGGISSNAGEVRYRRVDPAAGNVLLAGALGYVDGLSGDGGRIALEAAAPAWRRLARSITRPGDAELHALPLAARSVDFGRPDRVTVVRDPADARPFARWRSIKGQLWREGAIARDFPVLKHALLPLVGSLQAVRGVVLRLRL